MASYALLPGASDALASRLEAATVGDPAGESDNTFNAACTGNNEHSHLTIGIGTRPLVDALKAEPFAAVLFRAISVSLYQGGDFGAAQSKLYELHAC